MIKLNSFLLLAFSICVSLQTSTFQVGNRTGAKMSIFEKIDTQRHRRDINLCKPVSQPDATGLARDEIVAKPSAFFSDHSEEHSTPAKSVRIAKSIGRIATEKPSISKDEEV